MCRLWNVFCLVCLIATIIALLTACAPRAGCYVGMSLIPPGPVVICGADIEPEEEDDGDA